MEFTEMRNKLMEHFNEMVKDVDHLFEVAVDKDEMWNLYLDSFPVGTNEIYRERGSMIVVVAGNSSRPLETLL